LISGHSSLMLVTLTVIRPYYNITKTNWFISDSYLHYLHRIKQKINIRSKQKQSKTNS